MRHPSLQVCAPSVGMTTLLTLLYRAGIGAAKGETALSGVLKSPAVTSGSGKHGSEQVSSLVAAHPVDQSKVIGCDTIACESVPHTTACISV